MKKVLISVELGVIIWILPDVNLILSVGKGVDSASSLVPLPLYHSDP